MQRPARSPLDWLGHDAGFRDLAAHAQRLAQLQADVDLSAPMRGLVVTSLESGTLVLTTRAAAQAAKLRQFEPSLLATLTRRGWQVSRIRIRPQPQRAVDDPSARQATPRPAMPGHAVAAMAELAGQTDGPLSQALARLVSNQRRRQRQDD